jgi:hypothetical protein
VLANFVIVDSDLANGANVMVKIVGLENYHIIVLKLLVATTTCLPTYEVQCCYY